MTVVRTPEDLPPEARLEREFMESQGLKSSLVVPLRVGGTVVGVLSCSSFRGTQQWNDVKISRLHAIGEVFANALMRKQADEKLQTAYAEIQQLKEQVEQENSYLRQEIKLEYGHQIVVGNSAAMRAVLRKAEQVAGTDSTVLNPRRNGHGQRACRENHPRDEPTQQADDGQDQLRGASRDPHRKRAFWPRKRRVHRGTRQRDWKI